MSNNSYWEKRALDLEDALNKKSTKKLKEILELHEKIAADIEKDLRVWYSRFAINNAISMTESRKLLNSNELKELKWTIEEYIKYGKENALNQNWIKQLENASARYHISRLDSLKIQLQQHIEKFYGVQLRSVNELSKDIYTTGYYQMVYEVQKGFNIGFTLNKLDENLLNKILSKPWATDGINFSERIWSNRSNLINVLHQELTSMIARGENPNKSIKSITSKFNTTRSNASRLVMTESAFFSSASQRDCYKYLGVEQYEIIATLDIKTSSVCRELDGKVFDMKDYQPGVTANPFHPNCRSCTAPFFSDEESGQRAMRNKHGKTDYVDSKITYKEWYEKYIK